MSRLIPITRPRYSQMRLGMNRGAVARRNFLMGTALRLRMAQRGARSATVTQRRRRFTQSGQGITTQHDARLIYRKSNMPRRRKRRWRSFVNRVNAVSERELGTRTVVFSGVYTRSNGTPGLQTDGAVYLYGFRSTTNGPPGGDDIQRIGQMENEANTNQDAGNTVYASTKYMFHSAVLDITVRNTSGAWTANPGGGPRILTPDFRAKLEVDVYEMVCNFEGRSLDIEPANIMDLMNRNADETLPIGGTGGANAEVLRNNRGVTPWDLSFFLSRFRVKILRKTKYTVNNQDSFTYQVRDPRRRTITNDEMDSTPSFNKPGWTRIVYIVAKLAPGLTLGGATGSGSDEYLEQYTIGVTRKYMYKIEGVNEDRTRYVVF